ncbi:MAG: hypothetical protein DME25_03475 [Verrucomicrobia bacterium]|nr:MAG: hypothetical protein DME25_03475 [Verrucomicrobiota bacterium]
MRNTDGLRVRWVELRDVARFEDRHAPSAIGWVNVTGEVAPMAVAAFAQRATLDRGAGELVFGHGPHVLPISQVGGAGDAGFAAAVGSHTARAAQPIGQIPGLLIRCIISTRRPGPVTVLKAWGFAQHSARRKQ